MSGDEMLEKAQEKGWRRDTCVAIISGRMTPDREAVHTESDLFDLPVL